MIVCLKESECFILLEEASLVAVVADRAKDEA